MNKRITITIISLVAVIAGISFIFRNNDNTLPHNHSEWQQQYPHVFNNAGYSKLMSSNIVSMSKLSESQGLLQGSITNPLGIRDDILDYIIKTVPNNNESALRAAIKLAQNDQLIYYGGLTPEQALKLADNDVLLQICLGVYLPDNNSIRLTSNMDSLLRNTKARNKHMWDIDHKYFSWKVIGSGLNNDEENKACAEGDF